MASCGALDSTGAGGGRDLLELEEADVVEPALAEGKDPKALDKEYVRAWLVERGWRGEGPPPALPVEVRCEAARRYVETYERVTGQRFVPDTEPPLPRIRRNLGLGEA